MHGTVLTLDLILIIGSIVIVLEKNIIPPSEKASPFAYSYYLEVIEELDITTLVIGQYFSSFIIQIAFKF